jgi:hypothetical protein
MIGRALENLGIRDYCLSGEPTTEEEFNSSFKRFVGIDEHGSAIMSDDPQHFGVTWDQIQAEVVKVKTNFDNTEYQRLRAPEYPSIGDQLDALFHAGVFPPEMAAKIQAIKDKYPKG